LLQTYFHPFGIEYRVIKYRPSQHRNTPPPHRIRLPQLSPTPLHRSRCPPLRRECCRRYIFSPPPITHSLTFVPSLPNPLYLLNTSHSSCCAWSTTRCRIMVPTGKLLRTRFLSPSLTRVLPMSSPLPLSRLAEDALVSTMDAEEDFTFQKRKGNGSHG
jgi:hypothetical protein